MPFELDYQAKGLEEYQTEVEYINSAIKKRKVVIFGKPWNTDTKIVKYFIEKTGEKKIYNIELDLLDNEIEIQRALYKLTRGHNILPYVFIHGRYIGSRDEILQFEEDETLKKILDDPAVLDTI